MTAEAQTATHKADFSAIYTAPDPRPYFRALRPLDYRIPQLAAPVLTTLSNLVAPAGTARTVLDVCCSYGINAAMMRAGLEEVGARYADPGLDGLSPEELAAADRTYYAPPSPGLRVLGLDASAPAVGYARRAGLLDDAWAEDLERDDPSPELAAGVRDVDLIVSTGGYGYVGVPTFERLLRCLADPGSVWLAVFVLRVFDYAPMADLLETYGLVTERLPGTFRQRRFASQEEERAAIEDVRARGLDPTGLESTGWFHAECHLSRPAGDAARRPVGSLMAASAGVAR